MPLILQSSLSTPGKVSNCVKIKFNVSCYRQVNFKSTAPAGSENAAGLTVWALLPGLEEFTFSVVLKTGRLFVFGKERRSVRGSCFLRTPWTKYSALLHVRACSTQMIPYSADFVGTRLTGQRTHLGSAEQGINGVDEQTDCSFPLLS